MCFCIELNHRILLGRVLEEGRGNCYKVSQVGFPRIGIWQGKSCSSAAWRSEENGIGQGKKLDKGVFFLISFFTVFYGLCYYNSPQIFPCPLPPPPAPSGICTPLSMFMGHGYVLWLLYFICYTSHPHNYSVTTNFYFLFLHLLQTSLTHSHLATIKTFSVSMILFLFCFLFILLFRFNHW